MKNFIKILSSIILCSVSMFASTDNSIVNQLRAEQINDFKLSLDSIESKIESYIIASGDITPTKQEVSIFYSLPSNYFNNFDHNLLNLSLSSNKIILSNTLGSTNNPSVIEAYLSNSSNDKVYSSSNNYDVSYLISPKVSNFISLVSTLQSNSSIIISQSQPSNTSKTWYEPIGNGSFKIYSYTNSSWNFVGTSDFSNNADIQVDSLTTLNSIACIMNDKGFVVATEADSYLCTSLNTWVKINTGSGSSMYNGDATILDMVTTLKDYKSTSVVTSSDPYTTGFKHSFNGVKNFTKRDSIGNFTYWIDDTNTIIVAETLNDLNSKPMANGSFGYILSPDKSKVYPLQKINNQWMIIADGYNDVVTIDITSQIVFDKKNSKYFRFLNNYWYETDINGNNSNSIYLTSNSSGRATFPAPSSTNVKYLLLNNDCSVATCYGPSGTNYFGGEKLDGMYVYYYSTSGKRINNLIDAVPAISIGDIYSRNLYAGLYNNVVYIKGLDTLNRTCYQSVVNNGYYTSNGVLIPTGNNLPSNVTCSTATYNGSNLILTNRTDATNWTTAPNNAGVYLTSLAISYTHILGGTNDFWTNNTASDGQTSATEVFTGGSRTSFPTITHTINALTKVVDTPNYVGGVTSTIDSSFKQWIYVNGYGVKNLVDVPVVTTYANIYNNGSAYVLYGGTLFQKSTDTLGRVCYKNTSNGQYWTKTGYLIQTGNDLPSSVDCSTATYTNTSYLNLATRTDATNWTTATHTAGVYITSIGVRYMKVKTGTMDFYTNDGTGDYQQNATEIFTGGSRTSFPTITHSINALTKLVDTPNNTGVGITSTIDGLFKQWYYASGQGVKNLIDVIIIGSQPYNNVNVLANSVGWSSYSGTIFYKSGNLWKYQSNNTNWNPCSLLSNTGSYTNWTPDYVNLKCDRTVMTNTNYIVGTQYNQFNGYSPFYVTTTLLNRFYISTNGTYLINLTNQSGVGVVGSIGLFDAFTTNGGTCEVKIISIANKNFSLTTNGNQFCFVGVTSCCVTVPGVTFSGGGSIDTNLLTRFLVTATGKTLCLRGSNSTTACIKMSDKTTQNCPDTSWTDTGTNCQKVVTESKYFNMI